MSEVTIGSVVAGCRIDAVAGKGGMGVVYRAKQLALDRTVALKLITPELARDPGFASRFKRESLIAASIDHPNVIPVHEAGERDGLLYIVMRYVDGTDLRALIAEEGGLDPVRASRIIAQVASALAAAHSRGLVHRDVKPANVLIDSLDGREHPYLTDFGIAHQVESTTVVTSTGAPVGTIDYLAPERIDGGRGDARADVYGLGCVLYEALTGAAPYPRDNYVAKIYAHLNAPVPSAAEDNPRVAPALAEVCARAMDKDPAARFASATDFGDAALAAAGGGSGRVPAGPRRAPGPHRPGADGKQTARLPGARPHRKRAAIVAAIAVIVVVGGLVLAISPGDEENVRPPASDSVRYVVGKPIDVGRKPDGLAIGDRSVWVANSGDGTASRIDPADDQSGEEIPVGDNPDSVAIGGGSVWITNRDDNSVTELDARTGEQRGGPIPVGPAPEGVAYGEATVWVAESGGGSVSRIDPKTRTVTRVRVGTGPVGVAVGDGSVWVANATDGTVARIDPRTNALIRTPVEVGSQPRGIAVGHGSVWVTSAAEGSVARLDSRSGAVVGEPIRVGQNPRAVAVGPDAVWVTSTDGDTATPIDPRTGRAGPAIEVGSAPVGVGVDQRRTWIALGDDDSVVAVTPAR
jgi:YVTN family beta-propeller protein